MGAVDPITLSYIKINAVVLIKIQKILLILKNTVILDGVIKNQIPAKMKKYLENVELDC